MVHQKVTPLEQVWCPLFGLSGTDPAGRFWGRRSVPRDPPPPPAAPPPRHSSPSSDSSDGPPPLVEDSSDGPPANRSPRSDTSSSLSEVEPLSAWRSPAALAAALARARDATRAALEGRDPVSLEEALFERGDPERGGGTVRRAARGTRNGEEGLA